MKYQILTLFLLTILFSTETRGWVFNYPKNPDGVDYPDCPRHPKCDPDPNKSCARSPPKCRPPHQ